MKLVYLLGVLSLLALSITATPDKSLTSLDRGVRQASNEAWGRLRSRSKKGKKERKGKKGKARKGKKGMKAAKGVNGKQRKEDTRKKSTKGNELKQGKGNRREKSKKGNENKGNKKQKFKTRKNEKNERTDPTPGCSDFYDNLRKFRYDQNQRKKVIRIDRSITKLRKKVEKAATAFMNGAEFFKDCPLPECQKIYNSLRECNVTVPDFCSPDIFLEENPELVPLYEALDSCESILTMSTGEGDVCINVCPDDFDGTCSYAPVGSPDCNFNELEDKLKKFSQICFDGNVQGTYSNCTSLLKDSWETAIAYENATEGSTIDGKIQKNHQLATIEEWGPLFKVSFDLMIHSKVESEWSSVLAFRGNGAVDNYSQYGDRAPAIFYNKAGYLGFGSAVNGDPNYAVYFEIELNKLYHIEIAQEEENGKVFYTVTVDGKIIKRVENTDARAFKDVKVFAGDNFYDPADGSYSNLYWQSFVTTTIPPTSNCEEEISLSTTGYSYTYYPWPADSSTLIVDVKGDRDANIMFSPCDDCDDCGDSDCGYRILLGGWDNYQSVISEEGRDQSNDQYVVTPGILSTEEFRRFYISVGILQDSTGIFKIEVRNENEEIVMERTWENSAIPWSWPVPFVAFSGYTQNPMLFKFQSCKD